MEIEVNIHFDEDYNKKNKTKEKIKKSISNRLDDISYVDNYNIKKVFPGQSEKVKVEIESEDLGMNPNNLSSKLSMDIGFSHNVQVL